LIEYTPRLLVYRPVGTGAVNVTRGDLDRLQPGKYLNDTLIEFGLKWVPTNCLVLPTHGHCLQAVAQRFARPRSRIGGSNTPVQLVLLQEVGDQGVSILQSSSVDHLKSVRISKKAGYESVRKWTSRVDVFSKKYLVVPINEQ
jgi:hypothetical protein